MVAKTANPAVGEVYGRLTISGEPFRRGHNLYLPTECSCGKPFVVMKSNLLKGATRSCGCLNRESIQERFRKYPEGSRNTYLVWFAMMRRCSNDRDAGYINYGARGIKVCKRWKKFENFLKDMGPAPEGLTLERGNNDKGYSKANCQWKTYSHNSYNKRTNRKVQCGPVEITVLMLAKSLEVPWRDLYRKLFIEGMSVEEVAAEAKSNSQLPPALPVAL